MVTSCIAFGCNNLHDKRIKRGFHTFPFSRPEILNQWISAIRRENWKPSATSKICSDHFLESDYEERPGCQFKKLKKDAIPSVFSFSPQLQKKHTCRRKLVRSEVNEMEVCTISSEMLDNGPEHQLTVAMDVIKKEPEVDPLAIQWSDDTYTAEKKPLSEDGNLLDLHVTGIKTECVDHSYDLTSDIKAEETAVPTDFLRTKCKVEEELCDLDTVKDELKLEVTTEENEILTDRTLFSVVMDEIKIEPKVDPLYHDNTHETEENKTLSEDENLSHLEVTGMKTEFLDHSCDIKTEIKVDDTPVPGSFPEVKSEVDDLFHLDGVQQEQKVEVSSEEDEVLTQSIGNGFQKIVSEECTSTDCEEDALTQCGSHRSHGSNISDRSSNSFKCNICNEVFVTPESLKHHFHIRTTKKSFKCDVCGKCFLNLSDIKKHELLHTDEIPFHCNVCGKSFTKSWNLKIHARIHTGERPFKCSVCGKCFSVSSNLKIHSRLHTDDRPFKCDECGKCFSKKAILKRHALIHKDERPFKCDLCGRCFTESSVLNRHARIHTGERPFKCNVCGKCFSEAGNLKIHSRLHTGERPFKCDECEKCFSKKAVLQRHALIHTGQKPFKCDVCGKRFSESANLKIHVRIHTGERPFKCDDCGKCFAKKAVLKSHVRIHTGERPFKCNVCGKSFLLSGHLKIHSRLHTGERPFNCEECGMWFAMKVVLKRHILKHMGERPFKCDICGKRFSESHNLKIHSRLHTVKEPLK